MTLLTKAQVEATIGAPLDRWCTYYLGIALNCRVSREPFGSEWFWLAVAKLDEGDRIRDPNKAPWFPKTMKLMSEEALVAACGGAQALIAFHEEGGEFETARTLRAAQAVAQVELTKRHRKWDA